MVRLAARLFVWLGTAARNPRVRGAGQREVEMGQAVGDLLIDTLIDWEVATVFGIPGDGINGVIEALRTRQDRIRFVQTRHEEAAAFMACAYAKWTGRLGV